MKAPPTTSLKKQIPSNHLIFSLLLVFVANLHGAEGTTKSPPNLVFILADDLGWKDLACFGSSFYETPHIDKLAKEGMRFTNAYAAAPLCSATRASILSGWAPARQHLHGVTPESMENASKFHNYSSWKDEAEHSFPKVYPLTIPKQLGQFPLERTTFAERLKEKGYATSFIGKWHLGPDHDQLPDKQGFDHTFAISEKGFPPTYHAPYRKGKYKLEGVEPLIEQDYLTDRLTLAAESFMEKNRKKPFCVYLSHYAVHGPWESKDEYKDYFKGKRKPGAPHDNAVYAGMIKSLDDSVGKLMAKVKELGLDDNTVFIFFSDNGGKVLAKARGGGDAFKVTSMDPLRGEKGQIREGGIRVPCIFRWKGIIKEDQTSDTPIISNDFFPTILSLAGLSVKKDNPVDGTDITGLLKGRTIDRNQITWFMPHYMKSGEGLASSAAIRAGDYKLLKLFEGGGELYNLKDDIGEKNDISKSNPELFKKLDDALMAELRSQNAHFPIKNKGYEQTKVDSQKAPKKTAPSKKTGTPKNNSVPNAGENTSKNSEFLASYLKKNAASDANKDGILTANEFKKHKAANAE
jgi:arylsulfatase A